MSKATVRRANALIGEVRVPGDKSVSHRAILFSAMAKGTSRIVGVLDSADVHSTLAAVRELGARVTLNGCDERGLDLTIRGWGSKGPRQPDAPIDCGNSGTTARLLMGVLAGWPIDVTLTGDESLSRRPMRRVAAPLEEMGAVIQTTERGTMPVAIRGGKLKSITYDSPVASAQVKSAVLLAGLRARGVTSVIEPAPSRNHTERMLPAFGVEVDADSGSLTAAVSGPVTLVATDSVVPADPSSAAFLVAAATVVPDSSVSLPGVSMNPTRTGFLRVLERMGARVMGRPERLDVLEPIATITAEHAGDLMATVVVAREVPSLVDEVPVLAVVATQAQGTTRFEGIGELRVKEADRLEATVHAITRLGGRARAGDDWLEIDGPTPLKGARLDSLGDHRLAMAWVVAGLIAGGTTTIQAFEAVEVSYPGYADDIQLLGGTISVR